MLICTEARIAKTHDTKKLRIFFVCSFSKAFDCLPYQLVVCKLRAYGLNGLNSDSCKLVMSHFTNRKQRVQVGNCKSEWLRTEKGLWPRVCAWTVFVETFSKRFDMFVGKVV